MLGFIEAVDFIDEDDGALSEEGGLFGGGHHGFDFFDSACGCTKIGEFGFGCVGDDAGEGSFADAGRTPENHRGDFILLYHLAEDFGGAIVVLPEEVLLTDIVSEGLRAEAAGERGVLLVCDGIEM